MSIRLRPKILKIIDSVILSDLKRFKARRHSAYTENILD